MNTNFESDELYELRARVLKALASPIRLKIVDLLAVEELCVADIVDRVGAERSNISRHLSVLTGAHILEARKEGLNVYYSLRCRCALDFFHCTEAVIREQLGHNARLLSSIEKRGRGKKKRTRK